MGRRKQTDGSEGTIPEKKRKTRGRGNGEGSIYYRQDRDEWVAQISLDTGRTRQKYRKTRTEAAKALQEMLRDQQQGTLITSKSQTVGHCVEHWLENVHKRSIRESTYTEYRNTINNHILPGLGHIRLQKLTVHQVEAFYMRKQDEGRSAATIRTIHAVLRQSLAHAVRTQQIVHNVCDDVKLPRQTNHEIQPFTPEQAQQFLASITGHRLEPLFLTAIVTGMRQGELLALRWNDISFENQYLQVRRTVRRIRKRGFVEGDPKTASSRRKIVLPSFLTDMLKQHRVHQLEVRLKAGARWDEHDLVFSNTFGRHLEAARLLEIFHRLLRDAGLPQMRFHDLRHSTATLLLARGVHPKVVQELLGHSNISMTLNIYSHVLPSMQEAAMENFSDLFDQPGQKKRDGGDRPPEK